MGAEETTKLLRRFERSHYDSWGLLTVVRE
jgi:hypothetical protein